MRNPFTEFKAGPSPKRSLPMDAILAAHDDVLTALTDGYRRLVADEAGDGLWQPDQDSIERLYGDAVVIVAEIDYEAGDIEAFCHAALAGEDPDFFLMGPLGLYVSALCNRAVAPDLHVDLRSHELRIPLVGYRLPEGVSLTVDGHLGDLVGIALEGGDLRVDGNVGRYLGAGMQAGRIEVSGDAGPHVGEQMAGGEIRVNGRLGGVGRALAGTVSHRKQTVFEKAAE